MVCCSRAPTMLPLTPPKPPHHRSPAHNYNGHPNPQPTTHPRPPPPPVPGHNTWPICPNHPRHAASPDVAQPTTMMATPTHTPMARTPQPAPQPTTHHGQQPTTAATAYPRTQHMAQLPPPLPATENPSKLVGMKDSMFGCFKLQPVGEHFLKHLAQSVQKNNQAKQFGSVIQQFTRLWYNHYSRGLEFSRPMARLKAGVCQP
jgi:hypothetical protein